ncbi:DMT family transporter [Pelagovum pacificum]|uniref:DMT family transporter n=1 Tax=Pelagovum pacificum TaxID=2588711 RepID=A0A5C5GDC9_9RHOB|nr:DMT family transporter [Pelagovum pacificum]QQA44728.1 DMT family transporter [Pelagovum pacificum]TNY32164.1 DMT family transporter [Pelagovum pacificum]
MKDSTQMQDEGRPLLGVALVAMAVFCFASSDVLMKTLAMRYPVPVVGTARYVVSLILLTVLLWPRQGRALWRTQRTGLVIFRGFVLATATLTMGLALRLMPVGETVAIIYLSPFAIMLLAIPLLGERVALSGWIAAGVGFAGVLLILRPGGGLDPVGVMFALANAGCATAYHLLSRLLSRTETTLAMLYIVTLVGSVVFGVLAIPSLGGPLPGWSDLGLMSILGVLATLGHFLFTAAYREAPASLVAPVNYLHLVWAGGLGWIVFGHLPDPVSAIGMALVLAAGIAIALRAHFSRRLVTA